jgi:hypothetical protein
MKQDRMRFVICGLSITSSWGNWYSQNRDLPEPP